VKKNINGIKFFFWLTLSASLMVCTFIAGARPAESSPIPPGVKPTKIIQAPKGSAKNLSNVSVSSPTPIQIVGKVKGETTNNKFIDEQSPVDTANQQSGIFAVNEQFSDSSLDSNLWQAMTRPKGYRNNEEQAYRPSQVQVGNGNLQITANRDAAGAWHSGEVDSKWSYMYGEFEVRLALSATGPGVWPAAWLLGTTDPWPYNGEVDIFESINSIPTVYGTIHGGGASGGWWLQKYCSNIDITKFHTYKIVKSPGYMSWWVDGNMCGEWSKSQTPAGGVWPFDSHNNIGILNLAIGGDWPGPSNSQTPSTITMFVDYFTVKNAF
jgi:beta-glucanase (GH16 family)